MRVPIKIKSPGGALIHEFYLNWDSHLLKTVPVRLRLLKAKPLSPAKVTENILKEKAKRQEKRTEQLKGRIITDVVLRLRNVEWDGGSPVFRPFGWLVAE